LVNTIALCDENRASAGFNFGQGVPCCYEFVEMLTTWQIGATLFDSAPLEMADGRPPPELQRQCSRGSNCGAQPEGCATKAERGAATEVRLSGDWRPFVPHSRMARFSSLIETRSGRETKRCADVDAAGVRLSQGNK
jgi:hypothetical protein